MAHTKTYILGIESSCDDTSAAVSLNTQILSNVIATQKIHELYGGIVPELASRAHLKNIIPVVSEAIKQAGITLNDLDAIAFTKGPGLLGSLLVGTSFAKALSLSLNKPLIDVHHMKAHIMAHFIDNERDRKPLFPFLCFIRFDVKHINIHFVIIYIFISMNTYFTKYGKITLYQNEVYIGSEFKNGKYWDENTLLKLREFINPNRNILEIGGHCGTSTIVYSSYLNNDNKVFVYEPQKNMYDLLVFTPFLI